MPMNKEKTKKQVDARSLRTKKANSVEKRYKDTMSGVGGKAKPVISVKPKTSGIKPKGVQIKVKF